MPRRLPVNTTTIRRELQCGRFREILARPEEFESLGLAGHLKPGAPVSIHQFKCASFYCEALDQCGKYEEVAVYLSTAGIQQRVLAQLREDCEEKLGILLDAQKMPTVRQKQIQCEFTRLRAITRLLVQLGVADIRRGAYDDGEKRLKALASSLRRIRAKASTSKFPKINSEPSHGLEGLIHFWIGRARLFSGRSVESVPAFKRAIRETYESLHWHKSVDAKSGLSESLAYSQYQMASSLAFGLASVLDLQGRPEDAMALLWPAAVVFMGQADEIRYGYTLMMLGSLTRATAGSMGTRTTAARGQAAIEKDLLRSTDLLKQALKCFLGKGNSGIHRLNCARANLNLALTELRLAENSEFEESIHLKKAEDYLQEAEAYKASYRIEYFDPLSNAILHVARSRALCARGEYNSAILQSQRAKGILSGSGVNLGVQYNRACFAEIEALILSKNFAQASEAISHISRSDEFDRTSAIYLLLYESELAWHLGQSEKARSLHGKAADRLNEIENTWVKRKFNKIAKLMPFSSDLSLNVNNLELMARSKELSLWAVAQEELARKLLLSTETDEGGTKRTQAKQAEYLGIDRAYLNKVRKKLLLGEG